MVLKFLTFLQININHFSGYKNLKVLDIWFGSLIFNLNVFYFKTSVFMLLSKIFK